MNRQAGFSVAVPPRWTMRRQKNGTLVRSADRLLVLSLQADRSEAGRDTPAAAYALRTLESLPGFRELEGATGPPLRGSPYESGLAVGIGTREATQQPQRVTVAALRRPGLVTYAAVAFSDARARHGRALRRLLATLRGRPPA